MRTRRAIQWLHLAPQALAALLLLGSAASARAAGVTLDARTADGQPLLGARVDADTWSFRLAGERDPELVVNVVDARAVDGQWWLITDARQAGAWALSVADAESGEAVTLAVEASGPETRLVPSKVHRSPGVRATLDPSHTVQQDVGPEGGVVQLTAANGTRFTLTLPPQALLTPETITLTAIQSLANLPFKGGMAGGVEIGPAGLDFGVPARLAIAPPQPVPLAQETTFAYRAGGAQFFLFPAELASRPVVLDVLHTGGFGIARGTAAEQGAQMGRQPASLEDQFAQQLWQSHWRQRQSLPAAAAAAAALALEIPAKAGDAGFYQSYFDKTLRSILDKVSTNCDARKKYGNLLRSFISTASADGRGNELAADIGVIRMAMRQGDVVCYDTATAACKSGDHKEVVGSLQWWGQLILDGATDKVKASELEKCLTFQLEWDTLMYDRNHDPQGINVSSSNRLDTTVTINFHVIGPAMPIGESLPTANNYLAATYLGGAPKNCKVSFTGTRIPDVFQVKSLTLEGNYWELSAPKPNIRLAYDPGNPQVVTHEVCPGATSDLPTGYVQPTYAALHLVGLHEFTKPFVPDVYQPNPASWNPLLGALYAQRIYSQILPLFADTYQESTNLNLFHKPQH